MKKGKKYTLGIAKMDHWLVYSGRACGFGHKWLPMWVKRRIINIWNFFACWRFGHSTIGDVGDGEFINECMHCCKEFGEEVKENERNS